MTKKPMIKEEGQELEINNDKASEIPITLTYTQAKELAKSLRPPPSEKQKAHVQKLVEANKLKWEQKRKEKEELNKHLEEEKKKTMTSIVVKPKRIYKSKVKEVEPTEEDQEEEEVEIIEEVVKKPKKKIIKKIVEEEESEEDDDVIQKTKKATKLVETVNKLDKALEQMKNNNNRYDAILNKVKF
jgi:hypothetical protein